MSAGDVIYDSDGCLPISPPELLRRILGQTGIYILQFEGNKQSRSRIRTSTNKYKQVQTDIEVRTRVGRMCIVFGYEPHDVISRLTE